MSAINYYTRKKGWFYENRIHLPLTALIMEMMQTLHWDGAGSEDHSALAKYYQKLSGVSIG
jgi:hypothetical protein